MSKEREAHIQDLEKVADQLLRWAEETSTGGWSTHQLEPMKKLAVELLIKTKSLKKIHE